MEKIKAITIHQMFEKQVEKTPENIALNFKGEVLTYNQLNKNSNQIAHLLQGMGLERSNGVGIMLEKGIYAVAVIIGVLKAGGTFIVFDPDFPSQRLDEIANMVCPFSLITSSSMLDKIKMIPYFNGDNRPPVILVDELEAKGSYTLKDILNCPTNNLDNINTETDVAHIYFTSGSTGKPKGIVGPHKLLVHLIQWFIHTFKIDNDDRFSQLSVLSFDSSLRDIFVPLICGASVHIPSKEIFSDSMELLNWVNRENISVVQCVPSIFKLLLKEAKNISAPDYFKSLRYILTAGEILKAQYVKQWMDIFSSSIKLINLYGTTETMVKSYYSINQYPSIFLNAIPIGKGIDNTQLLVLKDNKVCHINEIGDLYIRTPYLTLGYLNDETKTKAAFIQNPLHQNYEDIVYKTGDLARYLPDGNVLLIGREDSQVKIRGVRVELEEIENILLNQGNIDDAVVVAREINDTMELVAFVTANKNISDNDIREYLANKLPVSLIPKYIIQLKAMPLNLNGKTDKKALLSYEIHSDKRLDKKDIIEDKTSRKVLEIWRKVLKKDAINIEDNFFECGGDSLLAMQIITRINNYFNCKISIIDFFKKPTIPDLVSCLRDSGIKGCVEYIKPIEQGEYYNASYGQERLWILNRFDEEGLTYNIPMAFMLTGELDFHILKKALQHLVERHEILRTSFVMINGQLKQKVHENSAVDITRVDISQEKSVDEYILKEVNRKFELSEPPLFRILLLKKDEGCHICVFNMHHIISDGWSINIFVKEFLCLYNAYINGIDCELPQLSIQYKDYSAWQRILLEDKQDIKTYWHKRISGKIPVLNLPTDFTRPPVKTYSGDYISFKIDTPILNSLRKLSTNNSVSLFTCLVSIIKVLLLLYTDQEDIVIGSPIAGREHLDLENQIGIYINTIILRDSINKHDTFLTVLGKVKETVTQAFENQAYPFDKLVNDLSLERDTSRNPLFDVMVVHQNQERMNLSLDNLKAERIKLPIKVSKFDITFMFIEDDNDIEVKIEYSTDLFLEGTIQLMRDHLLELIHSILENVDGRVNELNILTERERDYILNQYNNTYKLYQNIKPMHILFEERVNERVNDAAIIYKDRHYTYDELNKRANRLAAYLRKKGVKQNSIVAVLLQRSFDMIVGMLGILKAGGTILPLDTIYPIDRLKYIIQDADAQYIITRPGLVSGLDYNSKAIYIDDEEIYYEQDSNLKNINTLEDMVYIIYTSGSTGKPKGVMVEHRGVVNYINWAIEQYIRAEQGNFALFTSIAFDLTVTSIFTPLINGDSLYIFDEDNIYDTLKNIILNDNVNIIKLTPSHLNILNRIHLDNKELFENNDGVKSKVLIVGGENLKTDITLAIFNNLGITEIYNEYGPTEAVVGCMVYKFGESVKTPLVPIGIPASNTKIYVLDSNENLVPFGMIGELYISREGLARGYLNMPGLTKKKFIHNPFCENDKIYKTGDLARILPDGNIEFCGRIDDQVKIRGYRIELGEIENTLTKYAGIQSAIVLCKSNSKNDSYLVAYIVSESEIPVDNLKQFLAKILPDYMIPTLFKRVQHIPLTVNGKIDKDKLDIISTSIKSDRDLIKPHSHKEVMLSEVWQKILMLDDISVSDNFFDIGGTSLKAIQMVDTLKEEYGIEIPIVSIFRYPNIKALGGYINEKSSTFGDGGSTTIEYGKQTMKKLINKFQKK